jgi:hypothetical protein
MTDDHSEEAGLRREPGSRLSLSWPRIVFLALSLVSLVVCAVGGVFHYRKWAWGNPWQLVGWLLSMLFLLLAFSPPPGEVVRRLRASLNWKTAFFVFWVLVFTASRLWHFSTAPWNGNALFDESGWDLFFLKDYVIGHPYQAAWFHVPISRETLFHYYIWSFFGLFGYNILSYEAALFVIWCAIFLFTLLLVDLLFSSHIVTSITALIFNFLPFAFIYTFAGYRYPMGTVLCVISLYFLYRGFKIASSFSLSLGGIAAGLCVASSISGKQYIFVLVLSGVIYAGLHWRTATAKLKWEVPIIAYGCLAAAIPLLCYIAFSLEYYTLYETALIRYFWVDPPGSHARALWQCFFSVPGPRFFIPDTLPIPLPYYCFLLPGLALAVWQKRYEIALLGTIPVVGAFIVTPWENRLLLPIPFWIILMGFAFAALGRVKLHPGLKVLLWGVSALLVSAGLFPSIQYIYKKTENPLSIRYYAQEEVAVSRFLKDVVAGREPANPPRLERNEFNRIPGIPDPPYETLICQRDSFSIIHVFLHDYDDARILSFCGGMGFEVQTEQQVWSANKKALVTHVWNRKDLKLIWERGPKTQRIIQMFEPFRDIGRDEILSYSFAGKERSFYVLTFQSKDIGRLQERVWALPDNLN